MINCGSLPTYNTEAMTFADQRIADKFRAATLFTITVNQYLNSPKSINWLEVFHKIGPAFFETIPINPNLYEVDMIKNYIIEAGNKLKYGIETGTTLCNL